MNPARVRGTVRYTGLCAVLLLQACVVLPATREVYSAECRTLTRQMTLETAAVGGFQSCTGDACKLVLVATGAVTAVSAVVSGSIALVGNVVYWFERQGQCAARPTPAAPAVPVSSQATPDA